MNFPIILCPKRWWKIFRVGRSHGSENEKVMSHFTGEIRFDPLPNLKILSKMQVWNMYKTLNLTLFGAGDFSNFRGGGFRSDPQPEFANFIQNMDFLGQNYSIFNLQQLLFSRQCLKNHFLDHFCTTNLLIFPLYRINGRGGASELTTFVNWVFRPQKCSKSHFSAVLAKQKLLETKFWVIFN